MQLQASWETVVGCVLLMSRAHRLLSLAFMESLTIYGLVIALVPAPAVLKTPSSDCHRTIRTRARCLPRCSSSPTPSSSEQDVSDEILQRRMGSTHVANPTDGAGDNVGQSTHAILVCIHIYIYLFIYNIYVYIYIHNIYIFCQNSRFSTYSVLMIL